MKKEQKHEQKHEQAYRIVIEVAPAEQGGLKIQRTFNGKNAKGTWEEMPPDKCDFVPAYTVWHRVEQALLGERASADMVLQVTDMYLRAVIAELGLKDETKEEVEKKLAESEKVLTSIKNDLIDAAKKTAEDVGAKLPLAILTSMEDGLSRSLMIDMIMIILEVEKEKGHGKEA